VLLLAIRVVGHFELVVVRSELVVTTEREGSETEFAGAVHTFS
jgi:hypothetical protein